MLKRIATDFRVSALKFVAVVALSALLLSAFLLFHGRTKPVEAQASNAVGELKWTSHRHGFTGAYKFGGQAYAVETFHPAPEFVLTRIQKPDGTTLIEVLRSGESVAVTLDEIRISFDIAAGGADFPEAERVKLQTALGAVDVKMAQKVVSESITQLRQQRVERKFLTGLGVAALILGKERGRADGADAAPTGDVTTAELCTDESTNCLGCCGSGCNGCIGCCTRACLRHDACVRTIGQIPCLGLLPEAIFSIFNECL